MVIELTTTEDELPTRYLKTLNGNLGLTDKEIQLTAAIVTQYLKHGKAGLKEPYLSKFVFSTDERKSLCESLEGITNQNLGNKLKQLVAKGILGRVENDYKLNATLLPAKEVTFRFKLTTDGDNKSTE